MNASATQAPEAPTHHRCTRCGYVIGPQIPQPTRCPSCTTLGGVFTAAEILYPAYPSDEAIARDTRDLEAAIRSAYARLAPHHGDIVPLVEIRVALLALPGSLDRESVDAALTKLAGHSDVHLSPRTDQRQADPATQQAALRLGGSYSHILNIDPGQDMTATLQRIRSTSRIQAHSILAPLSDADVTYLAERMDVDTSGTAAQIRDRVAERAETNRQAWLADARQGAADGTLLYRADTDPAWVSGWSETDRQAAQEAAARLLERADREDSWAYIRDRATRWS